MAAVRRERGGGRGGKGGGRGKTVLPGVSQNIISHTLVKIKSIFVEIHIYHAFTLHKIPKFLSLHFSKSIILKLRGI